MSSCGAPGNVETNTWKDETSGNEHQHPVLKTADASENTRNARNVLLRTIRSVLAEVSETPCSSQQKEEKAHK